MGSILDARMAGNAQATIAVSRRLPTMVAKTSGSSGLVPYRMDVMNLAAVAPPARPMSNPNKTGRSPSNSTRRNTSRSLRAQRHANADLRDALGDEIRKHSIETNRGEQQRQDRKGQHQGGAKALSGSGLTQDLLHGQDVVDGQTQDRAPPPAVEWEWRARADLRRCAPRWSPRWFGRECRTGSGSTSWP